MELESFPPLQALLANVVLGASLLAIAVIDARTLRIPDALSLPLIGFGWLWSTQTEGGLWPHVVGAALGYAVLALIGEFFFRRRGTEGLGLGDAKLFAAGGAWLGWQALPHVLLIASVAGLIFAVLRKSQTGPKVAFGPWLALGIWLVWLWP